MKFEFEAKFYDPKTHQDVVLLPDTHMYLKIPRGGNLVLEAMKDGCIVGICEITLLPNDYLELPRTAPAEGS